MGGIPIDKVEKVKYLGHFITDDLSDDADIARQNRVLCCQGNMILRKFHMCSADVKLKLFRVHCTPMYCSHLWWNFRKGTMTKFVTCYHNLLKRALGLSKFESTSATCTYFGVSSCEAVIRGLIYRFMTRVDRSSNAIMSAICLSSLRYRSRIRRTWIGRLYTTVDAGVTWLTQAGRYVFMSFCVCVCVCFLYLFIWTRVRNKCICLSVCLSVYATTFLQWGVALDLYCPFLLY